MTDADEAAELAKAVERLRIRYEQYFAGVERFEPLKARDKVRRELRRMMSVRSNNTAYRFRLQTLQATLVTHETHWDRIARQIEEGTFKRDKLRAQRHLAAMRDMTNQVELLDDPSVHAIEEADAFEELDAADALRALEADDGSAVRDLLTRGLITANAERARPIPAPAQPTPAPAAATPRAAATPTAVPRPAAPAAPATPARPAAPTTPAPRPAVAAAPKPAAPAAPRPAADANADIKKLHEAFVAARNQTGENKPISMETLAETVRKQTAAVKAQLGVANVEFRVAIKDGKAVLKAIPK